MKNARKSPCKLIFSKLLILISKLLNNFFYDIVWTLKGKVT